ncbi:MAG: uridine diphosphate-N-acetylglucosamine-binding protein YvcK, partial [bacterium]
PAPGDLRSCLIALAPEEERLSELFAYRFKRGGELKGHSMGNLLLAALTDLQGGFAEAIRECSDVLDIQGRVLPSMLGTPQLEATMGNGGTVRGETSITEEKGKPETLTVSSNPSRPNPEAISAIMDADLILAGPGSLYTSILANFLEPELCQAVREADAPVVYICNLMTQQGETDGYSVSDHLEAFRGIPPKPIEFDHVLVNTRQAPRSVREEYEKEGANQVDFDFNRVSDYPAVIHTRDYLKIGDKLRHNLDHVKETLSEILKLHRTR